MHPAVLGVLIGLGAALVYKTWFAGSSAAKPKLFMQGSTQFWDKTQTTALQSALNALAASPTAIERVWRLAPAPGPAGAENALGLVRKIQGRGSFATSTTNVTGGGGEMLVAELLPSEAMAHPVSGGAAVLPVL
jgi:hypothetical protein